MADAMSPQEASAYVARRLVEEAARRGNTLSHSDARREVDQARERGDQSRSNRNR